MATLECVTFDRGMPYPFNFQNILSWVALFLQLQGVDKRVSWPGVESEAVWGQTASILKRAIPTQSLEAASHSNVDRQIGC